MNVVHLHTYRAFRGTFGNERARALELATGDPNNPTPEFATNMDVAKAFCTVRKRKRALWRGYRAPVVELRRAAP